MGRKGELKRLHLEREKECGGRGGRDTRWRIEGKGKGRREWGNAL